MTGFVLILPILFPPERDKVSCQNSFQPPGTPKHTDGIRNWKLGIEEPTARHPAGAGQVFERSRLVGEEKSQSLRAAEIPPAAPFGMTVWGWDGLKIIIRCFTAFPLSFSFILLILFPPERDKVSCQKSFEPPINTDPHRNVTLNNVTLNLFQGLFY
jgi:hypothetical protein